jgi:hypothetical protein
MCLYTQDPVHLIPLDDLNNTGVIANSMRLTGHASRMDDKRNANRALLGKSEGKEPPGIYRCRCDDNIKSRF